MKQFTKKMALTAGLLSLSSVALAHPGHALAPSASIIDAVTAGLMHPVSGLDHIVLAVGMGVLFTLHKKWGLGLLITSLLSGFIAVQLLNVAIHPAMIEAAILASVVLTAVAILAQRTWFAVRFQKSFAVLIAISLFGLTLFHGMAHAVEMPSGSISEAFAIGMITAMSALFIMGASLMSWVTSKASAYPSLSWLPAVMATLGMALVLAN